VGPGQERTNRGLRRVRNPQRQGEGPPTRLGDLPTNLGLVDRQGFPVEDHAVLVGAPKVQADDQGENLEAREDLGDVPWDALAGLHEELVLLNDDLSPFDGGRNPDLLQLADHRAGFERCLALPDPDVLRGDLSTPCGRTSLCGLELLEKLERVEVGHHDGGLPLNGLDELGQVLPLGRSLLQGESKEVVLGDSNRGPPGQLLANRLELGGRDAVDARDPDNAARLELPREALDDLLLVRSYVGHRRHLTGTSRPVPSSS